MIRLLFTIIAGVLLGAVDKVLVKRLPVASAGQLHMETIDGVRTLVSEIFVNR